MSDRHENTETHPSYGKIQVKRVTGGKRPLFGSSIIHGETIRIEITRASLKRDLNNDWIYAEDGLIEVEMSPVQFAELLTTHGPGVPCTLLSIERKDVDLCPYMDLKKTHKDEFKAKVARIAEHMDAMSAAIDEMRSVRSIKKSDIEKLAGIFRIVRQDIASNMPFAADQFSEFLERSTMEAKGEIEAYMLHRALRMAEEGMKFVEQPEEASDGPIVQIGETE